MNQIQIPKTAEIITNLFNDITTQRLSPVAKRQQIAQVAHQIDTYYLKLLGQERMQRDIERGYFEMTKDGPRITELGKQKLQISGDIAHWTD